VYIYNPFARTWVDPVVMSTACGCSEVAPHGANWQRAEEREGAAALHGASEALMDSLKGYYKDVAVAEAVLPDIQ
jgi:hypothetical protein